MCLFKSLDRKIAATEKLIEVSQLRLEELKELKAKKEAEAKAKEEAKAAKAKDITPEVKEDNVVETQSVKVNVE